MSSEAMSERELEEMWRLANEAYSQPVAARYERTLAKYLLSAVDEVRRSHAEVAELRERVGELKKLVNQLEVLTTYAATENGRQVARSVLDSLRAALPPANAQAKLENQEEG